MKLDKDDPIHDYLKILLIYIIAITVVMTCGCYPEDNPNCDCEITTDGDERYMTFTLTTDLNKSTNVT